MPTLKKSLCPDASRFLIPVVKSSSDLDLATVNESKSLTISEKKSMITRLLEEHNEICEQISDYNKYWRKYITITYSIFVGVMCILTYVVFIFPGLKWIVLFEYQISFTAHLLLIFIITYSASSVSHFNHILYRNLCSLYAENCFSIGFKIKVRFKKQKNRLIKDFKYLFQLRNYIQKLGDNKIGFTLINGVLITRSSFHFVSLYLISCK